MTADTTVLIAVVVFVLWLIAFRYYERLWLPPGALFPIGYFLHAFIAPQIYESFGAINTTNLPFLYVFSLAAFGAALVGYIAGQQTSNSLAGPDIGVDDFGKYKAGIIKLLCLALVAYLAIYVLGSGAASTAKGAGAYDLDLSPAQRVAKLTLLIPGLLVAWYMILSTDKRRRTPERELWWGAFLLMMAVNLLLFARWDIVMTLLLVGMFHHYRVKRFTGFQLLAAGVLLVVIQAVAQLRVLHAGIGELSTRDIAEHFSTVAELGLANTVVSLAASIPGQDVFAEVIDLVEVAGGYQYGLTYVQSAASLAMPRLLGFDLPWETPAYWFRNAFAPEVEAHGFDFSALSEAFLNFGAAGFGIFIFWGFAIAKASTAIRSSRSFAGTLLGLLTVVGLTFGLRTDSYALLRSILYMWAATVLLGKSYRWLWLATRRPRPLGIEQQRMA